jgi:hypothetical protein
MLIKLFNQQFTYKVLKYLDLPNSVKQFKSYTMAAPAEKPPTKPAEDKKRHARPFPKKSDEKKEGILILRFGKGNNFYKFRHALSEVCLKEFGNLGRLIEEEKAYVPEFHQFVAPAGMILDADEERALKLEAVKEYAKKVAKVETDGPKMYGLIRAYLLVES